MVKKNNTCIVTDAIFYNINGNTNVSLGQNALYKNTGKSNLVAVGDSALFHNGQKAPFPYHGGYNTALCYKSLFYNTSGTHNTAIGGYAYITSYDFINTTCRGFYHGGMSYTSNSIEIGNTSVIWI